MNIQNLIDGLSALGFVDGYVIAGEPAEIVLWENSEPQPSYNEIKEASIRGEYMRKFADVEKSRQFAYQSNSDPLFFGWQRGENTEQDWLNAVQAVKDAHPYPEEG